LGTSGSSRGSGSNTPLVPTWLDNPGASLPAGDSPGAAENQDGGGASAPQAGHGGDTSPYGDRASRDNPLPPIQSAPEPGRFRSARRNFSTFAGSGGRDRAALKRAVREYVRSGTRGGANASRRMGASLRAAGGALSVFRDLQRDGVDATLRRLNLGNLVGRPADVVFLALTDIVCLDGGSIDEGIARDAWLETVAELDQFGIADINSLTPDQMREFFIAFVAHAIETRIFQEIGTRGLKVASDLNAIDAFEQELKSYIRLSVRDSLSADMSQLSGLSDPQIREMVDRTYREAWDLLEAWGDVEE
jgi:hypothetical protein